MKQQDKELLKAWEFSHKILRDIRDLAEANTFLAYGVIAQGQTIVDMISAERFEEAARELKRQLKKEKLDAKH